MILWAAAPSALVAALALRVALARRRAPPLPPPHPQPPATAILLPVRDEAANVVACVEALAAQTAPARLRVIDDHSTDATAALLAGLRRAHPALEVVAARPLAPGWGGKVNALETGRAGLDEPWVLTTDADTRHAPDLLARAHAALAEPGLDALSLAGQQQGDGGEALLSPPVFALLDFRLGDWRPYARGAGRTPIANGQFFLVRRAALEAIGGYAAIAGRPLDDVELARALAGAGYRVGFRRAGAALRVRMYAGLAAAFAGWRRNLALFLAARPAAALAAAGLAAAPAAGLAAALVAGDGGAAAASWALAVAASALIRPAGGRAWALAAPLDGLLLAATLLVAVGDRARGRRVPWRGRPIPLGAEPPGRDDRKL